MNNQTAPSKMAEDDAQFLHVKLEFFKKKIARLRETVDLYVNEVSSAFHSGLDTDDKQMSFDEITTRLDHCISYVKQKTEEVAKETSQVRESTLTVMATPSETEQPSSTSPLKESTPTSHSQPAATGNDSEKFLSAPNDIQPFGLRVNPLLEDSNIDIDFVEKEMSRDYTLLDLATSEKSVTSTCFHITKLNSILSGYSNHKHIYTDGSKDEISVGAASTSDIDDCCCGLSPNGSIFTTEGNGKCPQVGFLAYYDGRNKPTRTGYTKNFTDIKCNFGNHFDPSTGIFTAPSSGMYAVAVTLGCWNGHELDVCVEKLSPFNVKINIYAKERGTVLVVTTDNNQINRSGFTVIGMQGGERLSMCVNRSPGLVQISNYSSFSCFLVS